MRRHRKADEKANATVLSIDPVRSIRFAADAWGLSERQVRRIVDEGKVNIVVLGSTERKLSDGSVQQVRSRIGIPHSEVLRFVAERTVKAGVVERLAEGIAAGWTA